MDDILYLIFNAIVEFYFVLFIFWAIIVIITIALAVKKGYSGFLAFLLGLFIPL
jgi:uncharacterized membrane protein YdbT with pleckstrin-like domain